LQYVWNNQVREEEYEIPIYNKQLKIETDQPLTVQPGQTVPITIKITDIQGKPVPEADVTAYSFTKKFPEFVVPVVPDFSKRYKNRQIINTFRLNEKFKEDELEGNSVLNYVRWHREMGLDTVAYFRFLYPEKGKYQTMVPMPNLMTQFAPFVVNKGKIQAVHFIFLDGEPVYFKIAEGGQRYSFHADSGYHRIQLRTQNLYITIDSVYFQKYHKTIISIDPSLPQKFVKIDTVSADLTSNELNILNAYLMPVFRNFSNETTYLKQGKKVFNLNTPGSGGLFGPVRPTIMQFNKKGSFETDFFFENGFQYEFLPNLLKMRTWKPFEKTKLNDYQININPDFGAKAWTVYEIDSLHKRSQEIPVYRYEYYNNPTVTQPGFGNLVIKKITLPKQPEKRIKYIILFKENNLDSLKVYPYNENTFHQLSEGKYTMVLLLLFNEYVERKNIPIHKNGTNYLQFTADSIHKADAFSQNLDSLVKKRIEVYYERDGKFSFQKPQEIKPKPVEKSRWRAYDFTHFVGGRVFDEDGTPLPGVNVLVKGTTQGVATDAEGRYELLVPANGTLVFSFVSYVAQEIPVTYQSFIQIQLMADIQSLSEVVVVGYGTQQRRDVTGSVVSINNQSLQGRAAGVMISSEGEPLRIRGAS
ncbi:MAG: carboxypeptidase-like regulatory domain-containing protein, partial [Verrucomicrobia bacterium]|nr:carboxypeptidase-like regulatory domain-containing protein [Cytophagales bacterium]